MFEFLMMAGTYEDRKIARDDFAWGFVSTAEVNDGAHPYETAVKHSEYNGGEIVIVEAYNDRNTAKSGHEKWIKTMTANELPDQLTDCNNAGVAQWLDAIGGQSIFPRNKKSA